MQFCRNSPNLGFGTVDGNLKDCRRVCPDAHNVDSRPALRHPKAIRIEKLAADTIRWPATVILHVQQRSFDALPGALVRGIEQTGDVLNDEKFRPNLVDGRNHIV